MISIRAGRSRPKDRKPTDSDKTAEGQSKTYLAPTEGLVTATTKPAGNGAVVLENFWPTATGIEPRGGLQEIGVAPSRIFTLFEYAAKGEMFAATFGSIYRFTDSAIGAEVATGKGGGNWSTFEVQNAGGSYLLAVNGVNPAILYNGLTWASASITGVDTQTLSHVWGHRNRVFFIQKGTLSAWYLESNSIGGAAVHLPLSATFTRGGSLLAGATWSSDSGDGMDDRCVFFTDRGEVAVFSGSNPGDISNWSLDGVFQIGRVLGPRAFERIGGDLVFATETGLIPLSGAVAKDPAELSTLSLARNIAPDWKSMTAQHTGGWRVTAWDRGEALFACPIGSERHIVANMDAGRWMMLTGWGLSDIRAMGNGLYLAGGGGRLYKAWIGGTDAGAPIICRAALAHDHLADAASLKRAHLARPVWRHVGDFADAVSVAVNYSTDFPPGPEISAGEETTDTLWDVATWDVSAWGGDMPSWRTDARWRTVSGAGHDVSVQVQLVSNSANRVLAQLQRVDLQYTVGGLDL